MSFLFWRGVEVVVRMVAVLALGVQLGDRGDHRLQRRFAGNDDRCIVAGIHRLIIGFLREDALGDQLLRNAVPALDRRGQRTVADDKRAAAVERVRSQFMPVKAGLLQQNLNAFTW